MPLSYSDNKAYKRQYFQTEIKWDFEDFQFFIQKTEVNYNITD